jgi:hypothetical protein
MTEQPDPLWLADELELNKWRTLDELRRLRSENERLHALNGELGAALRRLISYCNTLENRLMEADGEHPAVQEAKEAYAKAEGQA